MIRRFLLQTAGVCLFCACLWAQQAEISGFVRDPSGAVVTKAAVRIENIATGVQLGATTNGSGVYSLPLLPPGTYRLTVDAPGFEKNTVDNIKLEVGAKVALNVDLTVGNMSQAVTVSGSGININTTDASVSTVVDRQFVENIPLNGRSFQSLLTTIPGVSVVPSNGVAVGGEITVNGQRTEANYFTVDGVSANTGAGSSDSNGFGAGFAGAIPGESVLGTTQTLVSIDALQEFRATTSTYSAEYGRTPGGQFSFNTRSGTNEWHGSGFEYLRNDVFDANNSFNNASDLPRSAERQNDFGGTFGGPVTIPHLYSGRDKTFFFFSYEGLRLQSPQAALLAGVPSLALRQQAPAAMRGFLNAYPLPDPGTDLGDGLATFSRSYSSPSSLDAINLRIDHSFTDRFKIFGRYSYSPSSIVSRDPSDLATQISSSINSQTITLGATNIISPILSNDFRFNFTDNQAASLYKMTDFGGATPFTLTDLPGFKNASTDWFIFNFFYDLHARLGIEPTQTTQHQFNVTDAFTASLGRHNLKWGVDYRRLGTFEPLPSVYEFGYVLSEQQLLDNTMEGTTLKTYANSMNPFYNNFAAFLQDEWKVNGRLSLSLGVRWDLNPAPGDSNGHLPYTVTSTDLVSLQVAPKGSPLWQTRYTNFAPRLGVAYQVRQTSGYQTVLRAGFGLFYDMGTVTGSQGYSGIGVAASVNLIGNQFPVTQEQIAGLSSPSAAAPYTSNVFAFDPHLKSPYTYQWNVALEQALGKSQTLTVNYVGSLGRDLYTQKEYLPYTLGNLNFNQGTGLDLTTNGANSEYNALQARFQRTLAHGLQALLSYTWSHAIDDASNNFSIFELERGSSDFDIRHNFQASITWDIPGEYHNPVLSAALKHWGIDARISARSALPVDVIGTESINNESGAQLDFHPNLVSGQPLYISDLNAPGGRVINYAAFTVLPAGTEGNLGRNALRGFDAVQADIALRREFPLREKLGLQFRVEAFNVLNHPIYGSIYNQLSYGANLFGQAYSTQNNQLGGLSSLYQTGGPRSLQLALRLHF